MSIQLSPLAFCCSFCVHCMALVSFLHHFAGRFGEQKLRSILGNLGVARHTEYDDHLTPVINYIPFIAHNPQTKPNSKLYFLRRTHPPRQSVACAKSGSETVDASSRYLRKRILKGDPVLPRPRRRAMQRESQKSIFWTREGMMRDRKLSFFPTRQRPCQIWRLTVPYGNEDPEDPEDRGRSDSASDLGFKLK